MVKVRSYKELPILTNYVGGGYAYGGGGGVVIPRGSWRTFKPVVDDGKCTRCGICEQFCPDMAMIQVAVDKTIHKTGKSFVVDYDYCKGCGICSHECPADAIEMVRES